MNYSYNINIINIYLLKYDNIISKGNYLNVPNQIARLSGKDADNICS